jgi:hypothetical protein
LAPRFDLSELFGGALVDDVWGAGKHETGFGVNADDLSLGEYVSADPCGPGCGVELELATADQTRLAELARDDGGV